MKVYYFSIYDVLRARTNQIADIRLCEGLAQAGCEVEMITPYVYRRDNMKVSQVFDYYSIDTPFRLTFLKTPLVDNMSPFFVLPLLLVYVTFSCLRIWLQNRGKLADVVIMSRTTDLLIPALCLKKARVSREAPLIVAWAHEVIFRSRYTWVYRNADAVVGTNSAITEDIRTQLGVTPDRLAISLNPISEGQVRNRPSRDSARAQLGLNGAEPLVVYTGKLGIGFAEADYILEAARRLPGYRFLLTGGKDFVVRHYKDFCTREGIRNTTFVGFLHDYSQVGFYQAASDVLVSYYTTAGHLIRYNLPNKICEYMLAGSPIVTCNFPATRDVLNEGNAIFVAPENADDLVRGIRKAIEDPELGRRIAQRALADVQGMTYRKRAAQLVEFFQGLVRQPPRRPAA